MSDPAAPPELPQRNIADRYVVLGLLGRGGMAEVFHVRDTRSGRELALKRLRALGPERRMLATTLFEREYHTLAQLTHPSVIRVHEYGVDEDGAHYTMELLQGSDLLTLGRRPWTDACRVMRDVASALAILHSRCWLHRDLSPRNVFDTADGIAKLIDFGAMMPMGVAKSLVGTPPLVPPEAVQQLALDAQADLYSLGALAYFMLTGRHAYPARSFDELRDLWRTVVRPPQRIVPDVPAELSELVMELLHLDRFARPASAAAVIERLDRVLGRASDPALERPEVSRAFLATPKLVGRDAELARVRERMVHSLRGRGAVVLVEGDAGSGRSRFLDACVLEARLLGATVLRADASDGAQGDYGVIARLGDTLVECVPELARDVARLRRASLARVVPSLADGERTRDGAAGERRHVQTALRDWFRAIARSKRIVIAVDDLERIDEPSLAVLAALAHKSERRKLVLVASVRRDAGSTPGLELMRDAAMRIELPALSAAHAEALFESLFGRSSSSALLAHHLHALSQGNPLQLMALAEHLVQSGLARYAAGSWSLSDAFDTRSLPASLESALAARITALDAPARTLAEALALTEPRALALSEYGVLCDDCDHAAMFKSLDALVEAGILAPEGERYRFAHGKWKELLAARLDEAQARALHARLARALTDSPDALRTAHHLMESGQKREAIARLLAQRSDGSAQHSSTSAELLERAVHVAQELALPRHAQLELRLALLEAGAALGSVGVFRRFGDDTLAALEAASGLSAYNALDPALPSEQRLQQALAQAQREHDALPQAERPFPPLQAIARLSRLVFAFNTMAGIALEADLAERVPCLSPFCAAWPPMRLLELSTEACRDHLAGRFAKARDVYLKILAEIDRGALGTEVTPLASRARLNALYALGIVEASLAHSTAELRVSELEQHIGYRVNAWRVRMMHHAVRGDLEESRRCERRAQLLLLQDGVRPFPSTDMMTETSARAMSDDLEGLRGMLDRLREVSERLPGRKLVYEIAQCHVLRLQGDAALALERFAHLFANASPERSVRFTSIGAAQLSLLAALGRHDEVARLGAHFWLASRARGLQLIDCGAFIRPLAISLAHTGDAQTAVELSEALIAAYEAAGASGLILGSCYEARARVALALRDSTAFELWTARCRSEYQRAHNPAIAYKLARLLRDGQLAHLAEPIVSTDMLETTAATPSELQPAQGTAISRMAECVDALERSRCALTLLLEESGAEEGHLYGWLGGRLSHLASVPEVSPPARLEIVLQQYLDAELRAADTTAAGGGQQPSGGEFERLGTHGLQPLLLTAHRDGEPLIAAAVALGPARDPSRKLSPSVITALAQSLLDHDDVDAMVRPI